MLGHGPLPARSRSLSPGLAVGLGARDTATDQTSSAHDSTCAHQSAAVVLLPVGLGDNGDRLGDQLALLKSRLGHRTDKGVLGLQTPTQLCLRPAPHALGHTGLLDPHLGGSQSLGGGHSGCGSDPGHRGRLGRLEADGLGGQRLLLLHGLADLFERLVGVDVEDLSLDTLVHVQDGPGEPSLVVPQVLLALQTLLVAHDILLVLASPRRYSRFTF